MTTTTKTKTHWKKHFNYDYLGAYSLENGEDLILTIKETKDEMVKGASGREEQCFVAYFEEVSKGMILNRTNCKTIQKIHKSAYIEDWAGKRIQVYVKTGIAAFGTVTDGLRVREFIPKQPEKDEKKILKGQIRDALKSYQGDDKEAVKQSLNEKQKSKEDTIKFLQNVLSHLNDAN